jgi:hypothetical protein
LTFLVLILIYVLQKEIFPNLFNEDLSRIKLSLKDYKKIIYLIAINSLLTVNIFAYSLELFVRSLYNTFSTFNLILLSQLLLLTSFFYLNMDNKTLFLRLYGSYPKDKYDLLRRGFLTEYPCKTKISFCDNTFSMLFTGLKLANIPLTNLKLADEVFLYQIAGVKKLTPILLKPIN